MESCPHSQILIRSVKHWKFFSWWFCVFQAYLCSFSASALLSQLYSSKRVLHQKQNYFTSLPIDTNLSLLQLRTTRLSRAPNVTKYRTLLSKTHRPSIPGATKAGDPHRQYNLCPPDANQPELQFSTLNFHVKVLNAYPRLPSLYPHRLHFLCFPSSDTLTRDLKPTSSTLSRINRTGQTNKTPTTPK
jgi:hypothetical protein